MSADRPIVARRRGHDLAALPADAAARAAGLIAVAEDLAGEFSLRPLLQRILLRCTELLELFARHAAIALATARMHEAAEERARAEATASERDRLLGEVQDSLGRRLMSIRLHLDAAEADLAETARRAAELRRPGQARHGSRLRVLVAAGRPLLRAGVARLLSVGEPGFDVVGEAASTEDALAACRELEPDVVLADLGLPAVAAMLLAAFPGLAVVGLCDAGDDALVAAAIRAGARGCVDLGADGPELGRAVVAAGRGQAVLSGQVLDRLHRGLREAGQEPLTQRERQVRGLMELGLPDKVIAERLVLSVKTVEKHAGAVLRKTGARNRTELAAQANRVRRVR